MPQASFTDSCRWTSLARSVKKPRRRSLPRGSSKLGAPDKKRPGSQAPGSCHTGHSRPAHHRVRFIQSRGLGGPSGPPQARRTALCFHLSLLASSGSSVAPDAGYAPRITGPSRPLRDRFRLDFTSWGGGGRFLCLQDDPSPLALSRGKVERKSDRRERPRSLTSVTGPVAMGVVVSLATALPTCRLRAAGGRGRLCPSSP